MAAARPLSSAFLRDGQGRDDLEAALTDAVARARAQWPGVHLPADGFAAWAGARVAPDDLAGARVEDLWVAAACAHKDTIAMAAVEAGYFPEVDAALGKMGLTSDRMSDVKQGLRRLVFVGDEDSGPRIGDYRGKGPLGAWLRVTAMRAALKLIRKDKKEPLGAHSDDAMLELRAPEDDPELAYMKSAYRAAFKVAFQEALDSLDAKERTLLKQQIVDGLGIDELGSLHQVHRATAARWLTSAREKLLTRTRRSFMKSARISEGECESIMRLVQSQLDVSLQRRLSSR